MTDVFNIFFKKFAYKFPKGYPDMNNVKDVLLLESLLKELGVTTDLEETKLSPSELNKDATFSGGRKVPRIEILIDKITSNSPLELNNGDLFVVTDKEEVLSQIQGKTKINKAITLGIDEDGKIITTSDLKKNADFGGGGGIRGGSELTSQAESAQCITNAIRYSQGEITEENINEESIQKSKSNIEVTDFESASTLLETNKGWLISSVSIANALASQYPGSFIHNRGSEWVNRLNSKVKPFLKQVGIQDINKWNPADIWMVSPDEMDIEWPSTLQEINNLLLEKFNNGKIIGVSLKKADKNVTLKVYNNASSENKKYEVKGFEVSPSHAKSYVLLDDGSKIEFRNFNALTGFMGELAMKKAAGGKVGYTIIKKAFEDNGVNLTPPNEIKDEVVNENPNFKAKFEKLWKSIPELSAADFDQYYDDPKKTINQKYSYRVSKFLALEIVNALKTVENPNEIISDLIGYASSQTKESSVFVKAS